MKQAGNGPSRRHIQGSKIAKGLQISTYWWIGNPFTKFFFRKKSHNAEKTEREDPLVSSGIVCYAGNLFGSVPWATRYILASSAIFVEHLVELFWSVQVYFCLKKTPTKSHDYSRLFS